MSLCGKAEQLMPYVEDKFNVYVPHIRTAGELNYVLTRIVLGYLRTHGLRYSTINDIVGALECCKTEFARRIIGPYEDKARDRNGDVYPEGD